jgi:hypothetical protein
MSTNNESDQDRKPQTDQSLSVQADISTPLIDSSSIRIADLELVRDYIDAIDFTRMKAKIGDKEHGLKWSAEKIAYIEHQYKNWLYLRRIFENELLPPSTDIDEFWHYHILDTHAYHRDVAKIFGYYLHHYPYFGLRGKDDYQNQQDAFENTQRRYQAEYGEPIYEFDEDEDEATIVST